VVLETKKADKPAEKENASESIPFVIDNLTNENGMEFVADGMLSTGDKPRGMPMNEYPIFSGEVGPPINDASIAGNQTPKRSRIPVLDGETHRVETALGTVFVTINDLEGEPYEVFINVGKGGSDISAMAEAIGRLISLIFRLVPGDSSEKVARVIDQLRDIGGRTSFGFGPDKVCSIPDAISQALRRYEYPDEDDKPTITWIDEPAKEMNEESFRKIMSQFREHDLTRTRGTFLKPSPQKQLGDICPQCGQATLVRAEGCRRCMNSGCGYTEC
jgi:ribonucleoside-diphosphate reductase alpha chain